MRYRIEVQAPQSHGIPRGVNGLKKEVNCAGSKKMDMLCICRERGRWPEYPIVAVIMGSAGDLRHCSLET